MTRVFRCPLEERGIILATLAAIAVLFGLRLALDPAGVRVTAQLTLAPPVAWGVAWAAAGACGLVASTVRVGPDVAGFAPLAGLTLTWAAGHLLTLLELDSFPAVSAAREASLGIIFVLYAALVLTAAHLPETRGAI